MEFDIVALDNSADIKFSQSLIYLIYNTNNYGNNIVDSNGITVTRGVIIADSNYTTALTDTVLNSDKRCATCHEVQLLTTSADTTPLFQLADTFKTLYHVKMKAVRWGGRIDFDGFFMQEKSNFFNGLSEPNYTVVTARGPLNLIGKSNDNMGLTYQIDPSTVAIDLNGVTFNVQAKEDNSSWTTGVSAPLLEATIDITFSTPAFDASPVANNEVSIQLIGDGAATDGSSNPLYTATVSDVGLGTNEIEISIIASPQYDANLAPEISSSSFDNIISVTMHVANCVDNGGIGIDAGSLNMVSGNRFVDVSGVSNGINYNPIDANTAPTSLSGPLCTGCTGAQITGIATSLDPHAGLTATIPAGTQDELLIITGCGFGTATGKVYFPDADGSSGVNGQCYTHSLDIPFWSDNEIQLYVPSTTGNVLSFNDGAGSGWFCVVTNSGTSITSPTNMYLTIPYAILNERWVDGKPIVLYLEQQSELRTNCYGCAGSGYCWNQPTSDPCHSNGYQFTFQDPSASRSTAAFPATVIGDAANSIYWAMQQWVCATGVNFTMGTVLDQQDMCLVDDGNNMILSSPQGGADLPIGAGAKTLQSTQGNCTVNTPISNTVITHNYYITAVSDIDMVYDNTTLATLSSSADYDYHCNDAGVPNTKTLLSSDALHEFGHASCLGHTLPNNGDPMYYAGPRGPAGIRLLTANDIDGGDYVLNTIGLLRATQSNCTTNANHASGSYCTVNSISNIDTLSTLISEYPNPFESSLNIQLISGQGDFVQSEISTTIGQKVMQKRFGFIESGAHLLPLDGLNSLSAGIYLLKISIGDKTKTIKITKEY